ncbi:MAG: aminotransferase class I/II-fold pyridoxal phosphate-dependent enzyme [Gammaproteobacteria bacterium]
MTNSSVPYRSSDRLKGVRYEIRGPLAARAHELERVGYEVVHLNIGNPGRFGFRTPETMRLAMIENLGASEAYCHQRGIFPAREAVAMQQQSRGIAEVTADDVFIGNGVSELIDLSLRGFLNAGDEVLIPSPDYPLWTAAVVLNDGHAVHYPCRARDNYAPDLAALEALITPRTRALVVINPNNPTGAVYPRDVLQGMVDLAERHDLMVLTDEIYDQMLYDGAEHIPLASLCPPNVLCGTYGGLSKIYRACGYRVGWLSFSGAVGRATDYLHSLELLSSLRLCANVPGQWAVQTALGGHQSIHALTAPDGRLHQSRQAVIDAVARSAFLSTVIPMGSMYAFLEVDTTSLPNFEDHAFALRLLEEQHVLVAPGTSFNVQETNRFRITLLPDRDTLDDVFSRIEQLLVQMASDAVASRSA